MIDLNQLGTLLRCPGGNVETAPAQKAAGVQWATLNLGTDPCVQRDPSVWDKQREHYRQHGVPHGPWCYVKTMDELRWLVGVAVDWESDLVGVNLENVIEEPIELEEAGRYLLDNWVTKYGKPVHLPTLAWVQNGQGWHHLSFATFALELFPLEGDGAHYLAEYERCIQHAFDEGAKKVTLLYSTTSPRSVYPNVAHCLYTADNVTNWTEWHDTVPQVVPKPEEVPVPTPPPMQTVKQFPYTGPLYGPSNVKGPTKNRATVKGLKRGMIRLHYLDAPLGSETDDFGAELEAALKKFQRAEGVKPASGQYGRETWLQLRAEKLTEGPNAGQWAMDKLALSYVQDDALDLCYPHPQGAMSAVCQGLHETAGLYGNWAIDFCAPGGTKVVAVERAVITKLSGRNPNQGANDGIGIFGWSTHYATAEGLRYFSTHYGSRAPGLAVGQIVDAGQVVGSVGSWPGDPSRSHTHLGCTHPLGPTAAKKRMQEIAAAPHVRV